MDEIRMGLKEAWNTRRGVLCRLLQGGSIQVGDTIEFMDVAATTTNAGGAS
jgi:MOSC domain-containing protein YiiM